MEYTNPLTLNTSLQYPQGILRSKVEKEWVTVTLQANIEESNINKNKPSSDIVFVIDKSGSMKSDKKMAFVQSTIEYYIRELDSKHRIGILLFNSEIENLTDSFELNDDGLIQLTEENKTKLLDILPNIKPEGGTNMSYALETAVKLLHERKKSKPLSTILFFTDGLANHGLIGKDLLFDIQTNLKKIMPSDLTLHTFGFGIDHDSKLLQRISFTSKCGVYYYLENPQMIASTFVQSLGLLLTNVAHDIEVTLEGQKHCRIVNNYTKFEIKEEVSVKKYKIYVGCMSNNENRTLLVRLSLSKTDEAIHKLMKIQVSYINSLNGKKILIEDLISTNRETEEDPKGMSFEIAKHYYRYQCADKIETSIKEISLSQEEIRFLVAQKGLEDLINEIKNETEFSKSDFAKQYICALEEVIHGMKNNDYFYSGGIHYAHAYSTMFYLERSTCVEQLIGIEKVAKDLSLTSQTTFEKKCRYFPAFVTYDKTMLIKAKEDIAKYVERYSEFDS